ncbi:aldo/keto reductase [Novosphingobium sp. KCTC 2891]|uniref:aldo/keto reductase n=1 Tax=unclassified Novosphingobium TaxID=2644732 RepID=UPI002222BF2C|nr:aldo/keto reductase [Novosphingobium sp. KCTC 2891]MCW1384807.1 aldo/keto reductase [Novosphingobium sp. KCTC 2891]
MSGVPLRRLGSTGLTVSRLCLGCMSFGEPGTGAHPWVLDEDASRAIIRRALDAGINFFDTANVYADGASEEITGRALRDFARRDEIVIATKAWGAWGKGPNQGGLSRKALLQAVDDSLRRLGIDTIDLYQIHRWDNETPIEETLETLNDIVRAGKARYIGASSMHAWQFQKALCLSERNGWARFVSMQNHLNLLYREEEREMLPLCRDAGIGVIPWSPLARGRLTRPWGEETQRSSSDRFGAMLYARTQASDQQVVEAVAALAAARGVPMAQVALAWVLAKPDVTAPIIGVTRLAQLDDALAALDLTLDADEIATLEKAYVPHPVLGHA